MKRYLFLFALLSAFLLAFFPGEAAALGTPHTAWGLLFNSDGSVPANGQITFNAYVTSRPAEVLTETSVGCGYDVGYWFIGVGNFPTPWTEGDIVHVDITNTANSETGSTEVTMTTAGNDQAPDLHLTGSVNNPPSAINVLIAGNAIVGETLTGSYTYTDAENDLEGASGYAWLRNGATIAGATTTIYTLTEADLGAMIAFEVLPVAATGASPGLPVQSPEVGPVAPANTPPTALAVNITGITQVGEVLTGNYTFDDADGDLEGLSTFRWLRDGAAIAGATSTSYTLVAADQGAMIIFEVTPVAATGASPGLAVASPAVGPVVAANVPPVASNVNITGSTVVGQVLTGNYTFSDADGDAEGVSTFRWLRDGAAIAGATSTSYTLVAADQGAMIIFEVTPVAATGASPGLAVASPAVGPVVAANVPPVASNVNITGSTVVGQVLTGNYTYSDADNDAQGVSTFRWLRNGAAIAGATAANYTLVAADLGAMIIFEVTPVAATGASPGLAVASAAVGPVTSVNTVPTASNVNITGTPQVGQVLTGNYTYTDADGDLEGVSTFRWLRNGAAIAGATAQTYTLVAADEGAMMVFEVIPVAQTGASPGAAVQSAAIGPVTSQPGGPPAIPELASPANGATNVSRNPVFGWLTALGASTYDLQVSTSRWFNPLRIVVNETGLTGTSFAAATTLAANTTFYWRMRSVNSFGASNWSAAWSFVTGASTGAPPPPTLAAPPNGSTGASTTPLLTWNASPGATSYGVQVASSATFANPEVNVQGINTPSYTVPTALANSTMYYWRVNATNDTGTSGWSSVWNFTTRAASGPPATPTLVTPANGAADITTTPTFGWNASTGANSYALQVAVDAAFATLVVNQSGITTTTMQVTTPLATGTLYFWRVNATNTSGTSAWSEVWNFTTQVSAQVPLPPVMISPANLSVNVSRTPTFEWLAADGAATYDLQVASNVRFTSIVVDKSFMTGTSYLCEVTLASNTNYFWRMRSRNSTGAGVWSTISVFKTGTEISGLGKSVAEEEVETEIVPEEFKLYPNFPNPFNPQTTIMFTVKEANQTRLAVFNLTGQEVAVLFDDTAVPNKFYRFTFDAAQLPTGIYYYRLQSGDNLTLKRMLFLK